MSDNNPILKLYDAFGVPADYSGPHADDFHRMIARRFLAGMIGGHTSIGPRATPETLVREHLSIDWQISHGTGERTRHFMPEIKWNDTRPSVLRDRICIVRARVLRWIYRNQNPYRQSP
jgi:hypothetical protein